MKQRRINLERAADAEAFGALAVGARRRGNRRTSGLNLTLAQKRAVSDLAGSLVQVARDVGAEQRRITLGDFSFELQENGREEILSIRKASGL